MVAYDACEYIRDSDHVPVCASMILKVKKPINVMKNDDEEVKPFAIACNQLEPIKEQQRFGSDSMSLSSSGMEGEESRPSSPVGEDKKNKGIWSRWTGGDGDPYKKISRRAPEQEDQASFSLCKFFRSFKGNSDPVLNDSDPLMPHELLKIKIKLSAFTFDLRRSSTAVLELSSASLEAQVCIPTTDLPIPALKYKRSLKTSANYSTPSGEEIDSSGAVSISTEKPPLPPHLKLATSYSFGDDMPSPSSCPSTRRLSSQGSSEDLFSYLDTDKETIVSGVDVICPLPCEKMVAQQTNVAAKNISLSPELDRPESQVNSERLHSFCLTPGDASAVLAFSVLTRADCYSLHAAVRLLNSEELDVGQGVFAVGRGLFQGDLRPGRKKIRQLSVPLSVGGLYRGRVGFKVTAECLSVK